LLVDLGERVKGDVGYGIGYDEKYENVEMYLFGVIWICG
jgi:hypothetical protein